VLLYPSVGGSNRGCFFDCNRGKGLPWLPAILHVKKSGFLRGIVFFMPLTISRSSIRSHSLEVVILLTIKLVVYFLGYRAFVYFSVLSIPTPPGDVAQLTTN
jgi:hypothetical protein